MVPWCLSRFEGLDDDHGSAAAWAGLGERIWVIVGPVISLDGGLVLGRLDIEQLAQAGEVFDAVAIGEQSVVPDAVETPWQDVDEEASDELPSVQCHDFLAVWVGKLIKAIAGFSSAITLNF